MTYAELKIEKLEKIGKILEIRKIVFNRQIHANRLCQLSLDELEFIIFDETDLQQTKENHFSEWLKNKQ